MFIRSAIIILFFLASYGLARADNLTLMSFWESFRVGEPMLVQDTVVSERRADGSTYILLTEPPTDALAHVDEWPRKVFGEHLRETEVFEHPVGVDGWVKDIGLSIANLDDEALEWAIRDIHSKFYGGDYKASWRHYEPKPWDAHRQMKRGRAPPNLQVSAASLNLWLFEDPITFSSDPLEPSRSAIISVQAVDLFRERDVRVVYSDQPGLVLLVIPQSAKLNRHMDALRRFVIDTDSLLGAVIPNSGAVLTLVGRERTESVQDMPPLRIETILTLAAARVENLAQSYERSAPFAGRIADPELAGQVQDGRREHTLAEILDSFKALNAIPDPNPILAIKYTTELFVQSVDWAPILLSRELTNTEYGQLLNITDQMLKSWSLANSIEYGNFPYPKPASYPDPRGVHHWLMKGLGKQFERLTFNWNTAGFGAWTRFSGNDIFAIFNTGSLPVSYIPEGLTLNETERALLTDAEDRYWRFFAALRDTYLNRVAQYAALHIIFQRFRVSAARMEPLAAPNTYLRRWDGLKEHTARALAEAVKERKTTDAPPMLFVDTYCMNLTAPTTVLDDPALRSRLKNSGERNALATFLVDPMSSYGARRDKVEALKRRIERVNADISIYNRQASNCNDARRDCAMSGSIPGGETGIVEVCKSMGLSASDCRVLRELNPNTVPSLPGRRLPNRLDNLPFPGRNPCYIPSYCEGNALEALANSIEAQKSRINRDEADLRSFDRQLEANQAISDDVKTDLSVFGDCKQVWRDVVDAAPESPDSVHRTPSVVVSKNVDNFASVGGHNIDGRSLRVIGDSSVAKGNVRIDPDGNVLRVNPAELSKSQVAARMFERNRQSFVTGTSAQQSAIKQKLRSTLREDGRPAAQYSAVALGRDTPRPGQSVSAPAARRTAGLQVHRLDARETADLLKHAHEHGGTLVVERVDDVFQISFPGGKPPITIRTETVVGRQETIEAVVAHAAKQLSADVKSVVVVSRGSGVSAGDMASLRFAAEARGGGGGGGRPPTIDVGELGAEPPRDGGFGLIFSKRRSEGSRTAEAGGNGNSTIPPSGRPAVGATGGSGRRALGFFFVRKGDPTLPFRRGNWAEAKVLAGDVVAARGSQVVKLEVPLEVDVRRVASITFRQFFRGRRTQPADREVLVDTIKTELKPYGNDRLIDKILAIRERYLRDINSEGAQLLMDVKERDTDFFVVEKDKRGKASDRG